MTADELIEKLQELDKGQHLEVELLYENEEEMGLYDTFVAPLDSLEVDYDVKGDVRPNVKAKVRILVRGADWKRII